MWDPYSKLIFVSVPSAQGPTGNTIVAINPVTGAQVASQYAGSEPNRLSVSGDGKYLYAGIDGAASVSRFLLPSLKPDITFSLGRTDLEGPSVAIDLGVAPGSPHTLAVESGNYNFEPLANDGVRIFDDATVRSGVDTNSGHYSIQWGKNAGELFAADTLDTSQQLWRLNVDSSGVRAAANYRDTFTSADTTIHYDPTSALIYGDDGVVVSPTGQRAGMFKVTADLALPDIVNNAVYFIAGNTYDHGNHTTLSVFNPKTYAQISSTAFDNTQATVTHLIRWGATGLAFTTAQGYLYITNSQGPKQVAPPALPQGSASVVTTPVPVAETVWDGPRNLIYASAPYGTYENSVIAIDPASGNVVKTVATGSSPRQLALSDDGQFLYVGYDGSATITRYALPSFAVSATINLGADSSNHPYLSIDIQPVPKTPKSFAVSRGVFGNGDHSAGVVIYDDTTPRAHTSDAGQGQMFENGAYDTIQFSADGTKLFAVGSETSNFVLYRFGVSAQGLTQEAKIPSAFYDYNSALHLDKGNGLAYFDDGYMARTDNGLPPGIFPAAVVVTPDSANGKLFSAYPLTNHGGANQYALVAYDINRFTPIAQITLPSVTGTPSSLMRFGQSGLAMVTSDGIYFVNGAFVH